MEQEKSIEKIKKVFNVLKLRQIFSSFVLRGINLFVFLMAIVVCVFCVYIWHSYIYNFKWDEDRKQEYIKSKEKEVIFNRSRFEEAVKEFQIRQDEFEKMVEIKQDIFRLGN